MVTKMETQKEKVIRENLNMGVFICIEDEHKQSNRNITKIMEELK